MKRTYPTPIYKKLWLTGAIGVICLIVGIAVFFIMKDQAMLVLSLLLCVMCIGKAVTYYKLMVNQSYEIVEGTCVAISPKPLRSYRNVKIMDADGNESSLLLSKQSKIRIGYQYRFYFKDTQRLTIGNEFFAPTLAADCFLGFEELGVFAES